ncbi:SDR family oxidoreductase [Clostridium cylindrosporum]|uniref:Putative oxidoreductase YesF n=1 Tax=Clostridium cylindrosporum DSM 605 TaxID=1121307 RepID=A0A0J8D9D9_CLOCY|nr:SDR family oxidoreductase [Clostridium cylindrosporum]KMT22472.1 putative oxidoreductase YesF [Clostridium cylindrosporum DSM 605]
MKILVTGASGNVGGYVTRELIKLGESVVASGSNVDRLKKTFGDSCDVVYFDFNDKNTFDEALKDVDRVFLMRPPSLGNPTALYPFIDALKKHNIKLVSFLSLMGVENNPIPPHGKIEKYIEKIGLSYSHIRPGFFMQNISGIHSDEIRKEDRVFVPAGKSKTSFIDATDIGLAIAKILHNSYEHINTKYTLTGSESIDYYEVANILSECLKRKIIYANPSLLRYRKHYINNRKLDKTYVNVTVMLYIMTRLGTSKHVTNDFFKITGKEPNTFKEFVLNNLDCF